MNRALMAATKNDDYFLIVELVKKGADNLDECLDSAQTKIKPHAHAMLLLIKAASSGDKALLQKLFGESVDKSDDSYDPAGFTNVQMAVLSGKVSAMVPIEIARRNGHLQVWEELLFKIGVNQEERYVHWREMGLVQLEVSLLRKIGWVKRLRLARNDLQTLPDDMGNYLKQVKDYLTSRCLHYMYTCAAGG